MNVTFLDTEAKLKEFFNVTVKNDSELFTLDVETDSTNEKTAVLMGIGIGLTEEAAYYIPVRDNQKRLLVSEDFLARIGVALKKLAEVKLMVGHNIIFDVLIIKNNLGVDLTDAIYADTILMKHCIEEEPPFALKEVAVKWLGVWADKAQQTLLTNIAANGGSTTKTNLEMWKADTNVLGEYCGWDVLLTYKLFLLFYAELEKQDLLDLFFEQEVMPLYKECVIPMKDKGFPIDTGYFQNLKEEIIKELVTLEDSIQDKIKDHIYEYEKEVLTAEFPVKPGGALAKELGKTLNLPHTKSALGKLVLINTNQEAYQQWIVNRTEFPTTELDRYLDGCQRSLWEQRYPEDRYIFNIGSNQQLSWLFFDKLGIESKKKTEKGAPKLDAETLEQLAGEHEFCDSILEYRKLQKLLGTYVEGLLDRQYQGVIYGSFLMFGTTSGRFSSRDPNLQNLPRVKEDENISPLVLKYTNAIKQGFIPPKGYKIVNADYSQLEPRAFAEASNDKILQQSFIDKEDLYGAIAKNIWKLDCTANEVKKKYPELRQKAKVVALAVVYGAEATRIAGVLKCSWEEANEIIKSYLDAYPGLRTYMKSCDQQAATQGYVRNKFGRVRHLPQAQSLYAQYGLKLLDRRWTKANNLGDLRYTFKSYLNNAKNFPIQSTAAHVVNRAMIATVRKFKEHGIDGYIAAQVHDELTCIVHETQASEAAELLQDAMENTTKLAVPLVAAPIIAINWKEAK